MKLYLNHTISFLLFILIGSQVSAQSFYREQIPRDFSWGIGLGPSFAYLDNGGYYQQLEFEILPSASVFATKKMNNSFDLRASVGYQRLKSGGNPDIGVQRVWTVNNSSFTVEGNAIHLDIMPVFNFIRSKNHISRPQINLFGGIGIGLLNTTTEQTKSFSQDEQPSKNSTFTGYIPIRAGLSIRISYFEDITLEGTGLFTFTDDLDGNENYNNFGDHLFQGQIVYRRYFRLRDTR